MFNNDTSRKFQQGLNPSSHRRNREADRLSLRRKEREETLQNKRRQIMSSNANKSSSFFEISNISGIDLSSIKMCDLNKYIDELKSSEEIKQVHGTMCIRILLSQPQNPPYKEIIDYDVVPILLSFFNKKNNEKLQFEAAWAVTNLCSSNNDGICEYVCKCNAIEAFGHLLKTTKHFEIMEQAVWGLGNIAGESQLFAIRYYIQ